VVCSGVSVTAGVVIFGAHRGPLQEEGRRGRRRADGGGTPTLLETRGV
jgi:hypothetical protein